MTFQVELWQVILLFITVISFVISKMFTHENRLTKVETSSDYIIHSLDEIKQTIKENCDLLKKHIIGEKYDEEK